MTEVDMATYRTTIFTRWEHGGLPVDVYQNEKGEVFYQVEIDGKVKRYKSASHLISKLYGKKTKIDFNHYFSSNQEGDGTFQDEEVQEILKSLPAPKDEELEELFVAMRGLKLDKRMDEVRKIVISHLGPRIQRYGYDVDDVMQEIFKGILIRNNGKGAWDSRKSSFSHYVYIVASCVLGNYHTKHARNKIVPVEDVTKYHQAIEMDISDKFALEDCLKHVRSEAEKAGLDTDAIEKVFYKIVAGEQVPQDQSKWVMGKMREWITA